MTDTQFPFRFYGGDASDWYGAPHVFEVKFERPLESDDRVRLAEVWARYRNPASAEAWLFAAHFVLVSVRTGALASSTSIASSFLKAAHALVPIVDVACLAARSGAGEWTAWSVGRQARPDPGPEHERPFDRSATPWGRAVDAGLPIPAVERDFQRALGRIVNEEKITKLRTVAEAAGLTVVDVDAAPPGAESPTLHPAFRHDGAHPDKPLWRNFEVPIATRVGDHGLYTKLAYVFDGEVKEVQFSFEPKVVAAQGGRAWVDSSGLHEVTLDTGAVKLVRKNDPESIGLRSSYIDAGFLYMTTSTHLVVFRIDETGLHQLSEAKLGSAWISRALDGKALLACGERGVVCYAVSEGTLKRVVNLAGVKAMNGANHPDRVVVHVGLSAFELQGLRELVEKKLPKPAKTPKR